MRKQKVMGRRQLLSLIAADFRYMGNSLIPVQVLELSHIGIAQIDQAQCLAYRKQYCNACYSVCLVEPRAIELMGYRYPRVNEDRCNGCGACAEACLAPDPAITILPPPLQQIISDHPNGLVREE